MTKGNDRRLPAAVLLCLTALIVACHRRPHPVVPPTVTPAPASVPVPKPVPETAPIPRVLVPAPEPVPSRAGFEAAEKSFAAGDYTTAARDYETWLRTGAPDDQDRTHFRLGLSYLLATESPQNARLARTHFQRLATKFPESQYRAPADLILHLMAEVDKLNGSLREQQSRIKMLSDELQRLKAIDMKRSPSRPPR